VDAVDTIGGDRNEHVVAAADGVLDRDTIGEAWLLSDREDNASRVVEGPLKGKTLGELAAQGKAILVVSSYLPELLGMCDTIGVMCRGELVAVRPRDQWDEHSLLTAALGRDDADDDVPPTQN